MKGSLRPAAVIRAPAILLFFVAAGIGSRAAEVDVSPAWTATVHSRVVEGEYQYSRGVDGTWSAPNRVQGLRSTVGETDGFRVEPRVPASEPWELGLRFSGIGRGETLAAPGTLAVAGTGNRVERASAALTEWFVNEPSGIEHGFTLAAPPAGSRRDPLVLELDVRTDLAVQPAADGGGIAFLARSGRAALRYGGLAVFDARGDRLEGRLDYLPGRLRIVIDDRGAIYPIVVDPVISVPDWLDTIDQANARFGISVTGAGDVNNDGYDDLIVGAERYDNGQPDEGAIFVYLGGPGGPDTDPVWTAESNRASANFGYSVSGAGDVNGDGYDDAIIGAPFWDDGTQTEEGGAFVYYGSPNHFNGLLLRPSGTPENADWRIEGNKIQAWLGTSVARAGNVNADLAADVIVGAPNFSNDQTIEGAAFLYHGSKPGGLSLGGSRPVGTPSNANWKGESNQVASNYGSSVASAGDVNNDGKDDIIVGAPDYANNYFAEGRVYLYLGSTAGVGLTPVWVQDGGSDGARFGTAVASAGDVNGDGSDDVIIGAEGWTNGQEEEGGAFVFHGAAGGVLGATANWSTEVNQGNAHLGSDVASAGDVNADGFADVLVAAEDLSDGQLSEGAVFVHLGSPTGLAPNPVWTLEINQSNADFGESVASAGDVNGDGFDDILVGADQYSLPQSQEGGAFLYFGCEDDDRDGICQAADNCPLVVNAGQEDVDDDGIGDACDVCTDLDHDTVCDEGHVLVEGSGPGEKVLVQYGSPMKYLANTFFDPFSGGNQLQWTTSSFDDSGPPWQAGLYGAGYEDPPAGWPVGCSDLLVTTRPPHPGTVSLYTRASFVIPAGTTVETLFLGVDYDDAYIAWINGVEVFRSSQMPSGSPAWDTIPDGSHESSNGLEPVYEPLQNISQSGIPVLNVGGGNVLAIGVWNTSSGSSDLVVVPRLSINRPLASTMRYLANSQDPQIGGGGGDWRFLSFPDEEWARGSYGVGYDTSGAAAELVNADVPPTSRSVYTRARFNVSVASVQDVFLGADWDDGFVAWINGVEVYRSPQMAGTGTIPQWNASPTAHESSNGAEPNYGTLINITTPGKGAMFSGDNVLAIGVWTNASDLDDLVLVPRLSINEQAIDNCPGLANPGQGNVDGDAWGDACDPDIDNDGFLNGNDNCPYVANVQDNCDGDAFGNACDVCLCDPLNDVDNDGICAGCCYMPLFKDGAQDNCPFVYNPDQADLNGDLEGDACDSDIDGDTWANEVDNCPRVPNQDQLNADGDVNGAACDCNDASSAVWQKPDAIGTLRLVRDDVCVDRLCTETEAPCGNDNDCLSDACGAFACTQTFAACATNADCLQDRCTNFNCFVGGEDCVDDSNCDGDFCANKSCTQPPFGACSTDANCTADSCANKHCTEPPFQACTSNTQCTGSASNICVGLCSIGGNPCVSNAACTLDKCQGTCSFGGNTCVNDTVCTADVCSGTCSIGGNDCVDDSVCSEPQTDICRGTCSIGGNPCFTDSVCDDPQTDVCEGSCSLSGVACADDSVCLDPAADTLLWQPPQSIGATTARYDTLRSPLKHDFTLTAPTACVETDGTDGETADATLPPAPWAVLHYLIRVENDCPPPNSNMGSSSAGVPRVGRSCP